MCWLTSPLLLELQVLPLYLSTRTLEETALSKVAYRITTDFFIFTDNGTDYGSLSIALVFSSSSVLGDLICRDINITNDLFVESDETFTVGLLPVDSNDMVTGTNPVTVTIQDNDGK